MLVIFLISKKIVMNELQALVQGKISPQLISVDLLIEMAEHYPDSHSAEYKLIEIAVNMIMTQALEQALQHV